MPHANPRRSRELSSRPEDQFPIIHGTRIYIGNEVINTAFTRRPGRSTCTVDVPGSQGKGSDKFLATVQRFEFPKPFSRYKWTLLPSAGTEGQRNCETTKLPYYMNQSLSKGLRIEEKEMKIEETNTSFFCFFDYRVQTVIDDFLFTIGYKTSGLYVCV